MDDLREVVWYVAGIEEINAKMKVCDCLKNFLSINQLKLQVPEKFHATEELEV